MAQLTFSDLPKALHAYEDKQREKDIAIVSSGQHGVDFIARGKLLKTSFDSNFQQAPYGKDFSFHVEIVRGSGATDFQAELKLKKLSSNNELLTLLVIPMGGEFRAESGFGTLYSQNKVSFYEQPDEFFSHAEAQISQFIFENLTSTVEKQSSVEMIDSISKQKSATPKIS